MAETIQCVHCKAPLRLPDQFIGQEVRCPSCQRTFVAQLPAPIPPPVEERREEPPPPRESDLPARRRPAVEDDEDYPRPSRPRYDDDYPGRRYYGPDRRALVLAFGVISLILVFPACCFWPAQVISLGFGLTAVIVGRIDLEKIKRGEGDPSGQAMLNAGFICGIISVLLSTLVLLAGCLFFLIGMANH